MFAMPGVGLVTGPHHRLHCVGLRPAAGGGGAHPAGARRGPAMIAFYLRWGMAETPRFTLYVQNDSVKTARCTVPTGRREPWTTRWRRATARASKRPWT